MKRRDQGTITDNVRQALELVRLDGYQTRKIDQLSGGQKQRVAMARALVNDPSVLLLDEPLGALDLQLRLQMQDELRRLHKSLGSTFVFVTHDQGEAMAMSDRLAVMGDGRVLQVGTPEEIYEAPQSLFVANFVGHTNIFEGRIREIGDDGTCLVDTDGISVRCRTRDGISRGQTVYVALRYEKIALADEGAGAEGVACKATVTEKIYMGGMFRLEARTERNAPLTADLPITDRARTLAEGDRVTLAWAPADVSLLLE